MFEYLPGFLKVSTKVSPLPLLAKKGKELESVPASSILANLLWSSPETLAYYKSIYSMVKWVDRRGRKTTLQ